jgi:succinate dehydrogenase hydrophobic anchor subunit
MRPLLAVFALCAASWTAVAYSQTPPVAGEPRQDQKNGAGGATKSGDSVADPQNKTGAATITDAQESVPRLKKTDAGEQGNRTGYDWNKFATIANAVSALAVAFFTYFLVRFTRRQADATQASAAATQQSVVAMQASTTVADAALVHAKVTAAAQLEETRRANALSLRAWLLVDKIEGVGLSSARPEHRIRVSVRNYGKLPAVKIAASCEFRISPTKALPDLPDPDGPGEGAIGAGLDKRLDFTLKVDRAQLLGLAARSGILDAGEVEAEVFVTMKTKIRYTDALHTTGLTTYSARFTAGGFMKTPGPTPGGTIVVSGGFVEMPEGSSVV